MATDVLMPQMGESIAEGTIIKWLKKVGDRVERDEPLFEISTDKVDAEIPSPAAGVLTTILAQEGETVAVNAAVARIGEEGEKGESPGEAAPKAPAKQEPAPAAASAAPAAAPSAAPAAKAAPAPEPAPEPSVPSTEKEDNKRVRSSPLVRNIAREHGVDIEEITGTGQGGRVTKEDILGFIEQQKSAQPAPAKKQAPGAAPATAPAPCSAGSASTRFCIRRARFNRAHEYHAAQDCGAYGAQPGYVGACDYIL